MAPIEHGYESNVFSISILSTYAISVATLLGLVIYSLYNAYQDLPIALRTRHLSFERRNDLLIMSALAVISAATNAYGIVDALVESYNAWTLAVGGAMPENVWLSSTWFPDSQNVGALKLDSWIRGIDWVSELSFALAGRSRDYWYAQQLSIATMVFSVFVGVEGRRRNIEFSWVYLLIAHLLGLSTAQALFTIALLLTPVTRSSSKSSSRQLWTPHWSLLTGPVALALGCTAAFPYFDDHTALSWLGAIPPGLTFVPWMIMNTELIPTSLGTAHLSLRDSHASFTPIFRSSALLSLLSHLATTTTTLFLNTPSRSSATTTTHNLIWNTHDRAALPLSARLSIALSRILSALSDNPVVRKVAWDVLLSAVVLCTWSSLRSLDVHDMLACVGIPGYKVREPHQSHPVTAALGKGIEEVKESLKHVSFLDNADEDEDAGADAEAAATSPSKRRSARASTTSPTTSPSKRTRSASPAKRGRGRPRKSETATLAQAELPEDDEAADADYIPPPSVRRNVAEHELEQAGHGTDSGVAEGAESAALAWGMLVLGGLGMGSAGVWGAETVGR